MKKSCQLAKLILVLGTFMAVGFGAGTTKSYGLTGCPVTKPPVSKFVPPNVDRVTSSPDNFWYGTSKLWTDLPKDGRWNQKMVFWRNSFFGKDIQNSMPGRSGLFDPTKLRVTASLIGEKRPVAKLTPAVAVYAAEFGHAMMVDFFPSAGCWKVTAQYGRGSKLTFTVLNQLPR